MHDGHRRAPTVYTANKTDKNPGLAGLTVWWGRWTKNKFVIRATEKKKERQGIESGGLFGEGLSEDLTFELRPEGEEEAVV